VGKTWVEKFKADHLDMIEMREPDRSQIAGIPHFREMAKLYETYGGAYTLFCADGVIAVAGVAPILPGVGGAWMATSELVNQYPKAFFRATRDFLAAIEADWRLHRIQTTVEVGQTTQERWVSHLGFTSEGIMRRFGADRSDHRMYARLAQ